jgi:hypothetical protein
LLAIVGGNYYYETPVILRFHGENAIWFNRDDDGYHLLNVRMLTTSSEERTRIEDNYWVRRGKPDDLVSPPHGRLLEVRYGNGDHLRVEFFDLESAADANKRYPEARAEAWGIEFPITAVEVLERVGGTEIGFDHRQSTIGGVVFENNLFEGVAVALDLDA